MHIIESFILLLLFLLFSNVISKFVKSIPISLIQVAIGLFMALVLNFKIDIDSSWFLLLFVAPLLFNDGRDFPKRELWKLRGPIFVNAIWLVLLTTVVGGYFVNWLIPSMPLAVSFALVAILSPTDPIAVLSISKRVKLPKSILHLVSGESLVNDASGLIPFKYAIAAVTTGYFSIFQATTDFVYMAGFGFIIGILMMFAFIKLKNFLYKINYTDVIFSVVLHLMLPFIIYVVAEDFFHTSGVIAVVAAGIFDHLQDRVVYGQTPEIKLLTNRTWEIITYCLNGIVFLILGIELPVATKEVLDSNKYGTFQSIGYALAIWFMLITIRILWIIGYQAFSYYVTKKEKQKPSFKVALIAGISGIRGAITMAGVLSVPYVINDGSAFPDRSLMLFIAASIIVITLIVATVALPLISPGNSVLPTRANISDNEELNDDSDDDLDDNQDIDTDKHNYINYNEAKLYMMKNSISFLENNKNDNNQRAVFDSIMNYEFSIGKLKIEHRDKEQVMTDISENIAIRRIALSGQRDALNKLFKEKRINKEAYLIFNRKINREESQIVYFAGRQVKRDRQKHPIRAIIRRSYQILKVWFRNDSESERTKADIRLIQIECSEAAIKSIKEFINRDDISRDDFNEESIHFLLTNYQSLIERAKAYGTSSEQNDEYNNMVLNLNTKTLEIQRESIQNLLDSNQISSEMGLRLRQEVNYEEMLILNDREE
ncbi:sodium:proton antiporter [Lactobacillus sp. S2-2]|uniref:cation:proton antiporter n=1 Tax=Lactobacillus sp. S2-2 TaxID=2692917 RepID=UPI001F42FBD4|nr:sodium:proton antiporter [Lactobacillus sp. S2-2]MCF6515713.1 sodium:proton antiporter [Lactobacillus sp. S2-2]